MTNQFTELEMIADEELQAASGGFIPLAAIPLITAAIAFPYIDASEQTS